MNAPLNVVVLGSVFDQPMGGVVRHARQALPLAAGLLALEGGRLTVLGPASTPAWLLEARQASAGTLELVPADLGSGPWERWLKEGPGLERYLRELSGSPSRSSGRLVLQTGHLPLPRGLDPDLPLVWMQHDGRQLDPAQVGPLRAFAAQRLIARAVKRAQCIVLPSHSAARALEAGFPSAAPKSIVVRHGSDHFEPLPWQGGAGLLGLGHLEARKNWQCVIQALARDPSLPPLTLIGRDVDGESARLQALAQRLGVEARVRIEAPIPEQELPNRYARADCLVLPSWLEGFGLPILEAMRAGVPVAIARAGALPEIAGPHGLSFRPDSSQECAQALQAALKKSPAERQAAQRHADAFRWERAARQALQAWQIAAEKSNG